MKAMVFPWSRHLVTASLYLFLTSAPANTNLLVNGDFSQASQLADWSCSGGSWSSNDASGAANSGSMELNAVTLCPDPMNPALCFPGVASCASGCMAVRPNASYALGGESILQGLAGIQFSCTEYSAAGCTGASSGLASPAMPVGMSWSSSPSASGMLTANAQSVSCTASMQTFPIIGGFAIGNFDDLYFTTDIVFADGFE